jgi:hypothetical protein
MSADSPHLKLRTQTIWNYMNEFHPNLSQTTSLSFILMLSPIFSVLRVVVYRQFSALNLCKNFLFSCLSFIYSPFHASVIYCSSGQNSRYSDCIRVGILVPAGPYRPGRLWDPRRFLFKGCQELFSRGVKWPEHETGHSSPTRAEVK